jgi:hypothetical protein
MAAEKYSYVPEEHALITNVCVGLVIAPAIILLVLFLLMWLPVALVSFWIFLLIVKLEKKIREQPTRT